MTDGTRRATLPDFASVAPATEGQAPCDPLLGNATLPPAGQAGEFGAPSPEAGPETGAALRLLLTALMLS